MAADPAPPTVLLVAHHGQAARYLLRTEVFATLRRGGVRVVILAPNTDEPYMREEFSGDDDVVLEPLPALPRPATSLALALQFVLLRIRRYGVARGHRSRAFMNKYDGFRRGQQGRVRLIAHAIHPLMPLMWRSRALRRAVLAAETRLTRTDAYAPVFDRHRPDLVIAASPGVFPEDAAALREARRRGVRSCAIVLGWDNPTSKGYRGADPDHIVVWSERMADQMTEYHDVPRERLFVGGVPFFDRYLRPDGLLTRQELFAHHGLDPARRLVVFCTSSPGLWDHNERIAATLAEAIESRALGADAQLVVRVHPNYRLPGQPKPLEGFLRLAAEHEHVHVDVPEVVSDRLRIDLLAADSIRLGSLFKHCDVLVNVFSTTTLEAFILDRPVVLVSESISLDGGTSGRGWQDFDHLRTLVGAGAAQTVDSLDDLPAAVRAALERPDAHRAERRRVAETECGPLDGRSGERVGRHLLELAGR